MLAFMTRLAAALGFVVTACGGGSSTVDADLGPDAAPGFVAPTALAVGATGQLAALALEAPWAPRAQADLATPVASVRYHRGRFYAVHPAPDNRITVVDAGNLSLLPPIIMRAGSDPRDIAFVDDLTAVVSQHALPALAVVDLVTNEVDPAGVDLTPIADRDEGTAAGMLAACGARVFVQLQRPTTPAIGVLDVTATGATVVRSIATAFTPAFGMPVDCASTLYVAEPVPLVDGGGTHEKIDLASLTASAFPIGDGLGEVGGFVMTGADTGWFIYHTEFGPSPSSHLSRLPGPGGVFDTFASAHVDHVAYDPQTNQVFFPDACVADCLPGRAAGVHVFAADTAAELTAATGLDVGFVPWNVVVAR
jgi:hypothetical protein